MEAAQLLRVRHERNQLRGHSAGGKCTGQHAGCNNRWGCSAQERDRGAAPSTYSIIAPNEAGQKLVIGLVGIVAVGSALYTAARAARAA